MIRRYPSSDRKKTAILALSSSTYGGGSYLEGLLPSLSKLFPKRDFVVFTRDARRFREFLSLPNISVRTCRYPGLSNNLIRLAWMQTLLPRLLETEGFDSVYTTINMGIWTNRLPVINAVRNMEPFLNGDAVPIRDRFRRWIWKKLTLFFCRKSTRIVAVSNFVKQTLIDHEIPAGKIRVIYHGIDEKSRANADIPGPLRPKKPFVASSGKFIPYANIETTIYAFHRMTEKGYRGDLYWAGGGFDKSYETKILGLVADLELRDRVHFVGYRPREEVLALARNSDVFLFPSRVEACPFTLLECLREGAAVVSSSNAPMPEFAADGAVFVDPDDAARFGEEAFRLATESEENLRLRAKAKRRGDFFRWDISARMLVECLEQAEDL